MGKTTKTSTEVENMEKLEKEKCPHCGAKLFRGLCPKCDYDAHPEQEVKKYIFPDEG